MNFRLRRWHKPRRVAMLAAGIVVAGGMTTVNALPAHAAVACQIDYAVTSSWNTGFQGGLTIHNLGDAVTSWTLGFSFANGQTITQGWNGTFTQSGSAVTVASLSWNGAIASGGTLSGIGFLANYSGTNTNPTAFTLNGVACTGANAAPTVSITSPAANTRFTAPASIAIAATAADSNGTVAQVAFYHDGILLGTDTTSPYSYTWASVPAQTAAYHLQAIATDNLGAVSTTADVPVYVDASTAPTLVVSPAAVSVAEGGTSTYTVKLSAAPTATVAVASARTAGDTDITVSSGASLSFTTSNWSTAQTVTLAAAEDTDTVSSTATITVSATGYTSVPVTATEIDNDASGGPNATYLQRFLDQYNKLHAASSGYFSPEGVPYHSVETLMVEAPDHGHETTSEAFSYWIWLEAQYGRATQNWTPFNTAWTTMENYIIPKHADQVSGNYNASKPATYAPEADQPSSYPAVGGKLDTSVAVGADPLYSELVSTYGNTDVYGMHWLLDVDNVYGYGHCGDHTTRVAYINTYQRGPQESVWETVAHPSCETFTYGSANGYLPLFIGDNSYAKQWRYTDAPDADARAVQAAYWAYTWAGAQSKSADVASVVAKAAKMGDYLRYGMYDKYFKKPGCTSTSCAVGTGKDSSNYLLSWYYAWGGGNDGAWSWRIGSSHNHQGYQNPLAAYVLSNVTALTPLSSTAKADWTTSLTRQLEFYQWLQSSEGAFAGGATNSYGGNYSAPPSGTPTFYGLAYDVQPVYHDPPSNQWFGFQAWSVERVAEYYYVTGNATAKAVLDKWVTWALANTTTTSTTFTIPNTLSWSGAPATWVPASPAANTNLHVSVVDTTSSDVGVAAGYARLLTYYAAKSGSTAAKTAAKNLIDAIWTHADTIGVGVAETRTDYNRFDDVWTSSNQQGLYIPSTFTGTMPNGDAIATGKSFLDIRSFYKNDPNWSKVQTYLNGGAAPSFTYHRFWAQADIAMMNADYAYLFPAG